jgi:hypothetical protein
MGFLGALNFTFKETCPSESFRVNSTVLDTIAYLIVVYVRNYTLLQVFVVAMDKNLVVLKLLADSIPLCHECGVRKKTCIFHNLILGLKLLL